MHPNSFMILWYVRRKSGTYLASGLALCSKGRNELPLEPRHLLVPSSASKMISKPMVHLVQTMHISCIDTNNVSKQKEARFHMTHVTLEFHRVRPKWFPILWYVQRKPCTYLASRLAVCVRKAETIFHLSLVT